MTYLGFVYGSLARRCAGCSRETGASIVQVGSALAYRGIPLQSAYCAAKHAIQGFFDSLRCQLIDEQSQRARLAWCKCPLSTRPQLAG